MANKPAETRGGRRKRHPDLPNLAQLISETRRLRSQLQRLLDQFPDDSEDPEGAIFPVLRSHRWRNLVGDLAAPYDEKRTLAIVWIDQVWAYVRALKEYFVVRMEPETFQKLPFKIA